MLPSERLAQFGLTHEKIRKAHKRVVKFAASYLIVTHGNAAIDLAIDECLATMKDGEESRYWSRVLYEVKMQLGAEGSGWKD